MKISSRYEPSAVENRWYQHWKEKGYFKSVPDDREPFTIVIPPPNVTGVLHMGHMLDNTIQDALIRKARMDGKNACWVPGTDHASIATEAKVVWWLREEKGLTKAEVGREKFMEYAWEWTDKYGGIILNQLERLGASCDWDRTAFTMDETRSTQVIRVFVDLYRKNKLYRDWRMVNWDPQAQTVLSNEEVLYEEEQSNLYHVRYPVKGSKHEYITIATTRPETILGDTAIAVHPDDERYKHLHGKSAIVPMVEREVPIIADPYVDQSFGTGALKITPAHDVNDYEIGKKHDLEVIDVLTDDGHMSDAARFFVGDDLMTARKKVVKHLKEVDQLEKIESYLHTVGRSERTNAVVEPRLSLQWYVRMSELSEPALKAVQTDEIEFFPKTHKNTYNHWMDNIRDWCISRQLWWGHRIPAYYLDDHVFVAESPEEALQEAREKTSRADLTLEDLKQDEDVLDTWFSSWLWPFSVFNGLDENEEVNYYYPTSVLVTAWDIIFLWVARMIMSGYEWKNERPFKHVYFHGMVRDEKRRKMSKSLGNSPDALKLIDTYGADGVRFGILSSSPAGGDLLFDEKLCEQGRNFCNKIWNALRLMASWQEDLNPDVSSSPSESAALEWIEQKSNVLLEEVEKDFKNYRLSDVMMKLYGFIWNDFCSWHLEMIKPTGGDQLSKDTLDRTTAIFSRLMQALHPFMPFITEEVWHQLGSRDQDCMMTSYPKAASYDKGTLADIELLKDIVAKVRDLRNKNGLRAREPLSLLVSSSDKTTRLTSEPGWMGLLESMAYLDNLELMTEEPERTNVIPFVVGTDKFYLVVNTEIDVEEELNKVTEDLQYQEGFVQSIRKKLENQRFVDNAPEAVVNRERQKLEDGEKRIAMLRESLRRLQN